MYCLVRLTILKDKTMTANIPSGCDLKDSENSARKSRLIDVPRPQPGQSSKPALRRGHSVKWSPPVSAKTNTKRPPSQKSASNGMCFKSSKDNHLRKGSVILRNFCPKRYKTKKNLLLGKRLVKQFQVKLPRNIGSGSLRVDSQIWCNTSF